MFFLGRGFTSGGEELGCAFSAAVCKIQAGEHYFGSLPLVSKEAAALQLCLDHVFGLWKWDIVEMKIT